MSCMKCRLQRLYYRLYRLLFLPVRTIAGGVYFTDKVVVTLHKDGQIIRRIVGPALHNKWKDTGLNYVRGGLVGGCSGTDPLKVKNMRLGSQCSDTAFTFIAGSEQTTSNDTPATKQARFEANWPSAGAINNICQAALMQVPDQGGSEAEVSYYNFGTQFDKPDGVSLKIQWTTTLSS